MPGTGISLLKTKLHRPSPAPDAVVRPRVMERLNQGLDGSLTLITAPAGYGKSTAASQWVESQGLPAAWLSLDQGDNDLRTFLSYFVSAVREASPEACPESLAATNEEVLPPLSELALQLINELLELTKRVLIVLDDYHCIQNAEISKIFSALLEYPLPALHLALISRRDPQFSCGALRAAGRLNEVRINVLRFTSGEGNAFFERSLASEVPADLARAIEYADGWPVALRLLLLRLRDAPNFGALLEQMPSISSQVGEYLASEVLNQLDPKRLELLLRTAALDRFCPRLCEAVAGNEEVDGSEFVEWMVREGLFVIPLDSEGEWFRYHQFFQAILLRRLEIRVDADALARIHAKASVWFEEHLYLEEAFVHGLKSPGAQRAIDVIAADHFLDRADADALPGGYSRVESWLSQLPRAVAESRPISLAMLAWQEVRNQRREKARHYLDLLETLLKEQAWDEREADFAWDHSYALRLTVCWAEDEFHEIVRIGTEALASLRGEDVEVRGTIYMYMSCALTFVGKEVEARRLLSEGLKRIFNPSGASNLYSARAQIDAIVLNCPGLKRSADRYLTYNREHFAKRWGEMTLWPRCLAAFGRYQRNDLAEAEEILGCRESDVALGQQMMFFRSRVLLMHIRVAQGRGEEIYQIAADLTSYLLDQSNPDLADLVEIAQVGCSLREGQLAQARQWSQGIELGTPRLSFFAPSPYLTYVRVQLAVATSDSLAEAGRILNELFEALGDYHRPIEEVELRALRALWHWSGQREGEALTDLGRAVALAAPGGAVRILADLGPALAPLLQRLELDAHGVEYAGRIMTILRSGGDRTPATSDLPEVPSPSPLIESLSRREFEVLSLLAQRFSNKDIAGKLFISVDTVKRHASNIYGKLGVHRRKDAVAKAIGLGLLKRK